MSGEIFEYDGDVKDITLTVLRNRYDEVTSVATKIKQLVKDGMEYRDIAVIAGDYAGYSDIIKTTFSSYDIPVFCDTRKSFLDHPIVVYLFSVLDLLSGFTTDRVCAYMKSDFTDIDRESAARLENYALAAAINYNDWLDDERFLKKSASIFAYEETSGEEGLHQVEVKNQLLLPIIELKSKIKESKNVKDRVAALEAFFEKTDLRMNVNMRRPVVNMRTRVGYFFNCCLKSIILMAVMAHSSPLLPSLPPARSSACSMLLVVMRP
jgi:ATP-dependent helicase/nuclease subunit B